MRSPDGTAFDLHGPQVAPCVVLIHGLGLSRAVWEWTVPELAARHRVLAYDILGHGETPHPGVTPTLPLLTAQLADLLDHCGIRDAAVIGFSLGGMIARHFVQGHPDRALALAVLHSPHRRTPGAQAAIVARVAQSQREGPAATVEAALIRWFTDAYRHANPQAMQRVRDWVLGNNPATYPLYYRILADEIDSILAPVPPITCPTLVMTGDEDHGNGPEMAHAIAAGIAGAQTVILPGLRHMALMEHPSSSNAALTGFLDRAMRRG